MSTNIGRASAKLIFALLVSFLGLFYIVSAEESPREGVAPQEEVSSVSSLEGDIPFKCTDYYSGNSVGLYFSPDSSSVAAGTALRFGGEIENKSNFPLVDGQVLVKVYQVENSSDQSRRKRTNQIANFVAVKDLNLSAFSKEKVEFVWTPPVFLSTGDYDLAYYFVSSDRFYHFGLPYVDGAEGISNTVAVSGTEERQTVYFDRQSIKLNNQSYDFSATDPTHFGRQEIVYLQANLINPSSEEKVVEVTWKTTAWGGEKAGVVPVVDKQFLTLRPGGIYSVSHMPLHQGGAITLVEAEVRDGENVSQFQSWFARDEIEDARISIASVNGYPLEMDKESSLFACVEGVPGLVGSELNLDFKLLDSKNREVFSDTKPISLRAGDSGAISEFTAKSNSHVFTLETTLRNGAEVLDRVEVQYNCAVLDPENCHKGIDLPGKLPFLAVIVGLVGLIFLLRFYQKRKNHIIAE